jgi:hypothetical protein
MKKFILILLFFFLTREQTMASSSAGDLFVEPGALKLSLQARLLPPSITEKLTEIAGIIYETPKPKPYSLYDHRSVFSHVTDRAVRLYNADQRDKEREEKLKQKLINAIKDCDRLRSPTTSDLSLIFISHLGVTHREEFM